MRIAIFSDIHGNATALDAVLREVGDVDEYWIAGDLCAIGPDPVGALERVLSLPNTRFVRGNTDRYTYAGQRPPLGAAAVRTTVYGWLRFRGIELQDGIRKSALSIGAYWPVRSDDSRARPKRSARDG